MVACVIMHLRPLASFLLGLSMIGGALAIKPTEERTWTSTSGTKVTAVALELTKNGSVELETPDSRKITLGIDHFSQADQDFLEKHFRGSGDVAGPPLNTGTHRGPIEADADTSYYLYLPKDFDKSAKSPVMIWTQSDGAKKETLERFSEAADLLGMIIASPVEARNEGQVTLLNNLVHSNDVLRKLRRNHSIHSKAIHYGGNNTGAAAAFWNSTKNKSAGTFTVAGFFTKEMTGGNEGFHFMAGGATSANRYLTAWSADKFGDSGTHYLYEGGREMPEEKDVTIGMIWMYSQGLYEGLASRTTEAKSFERRVLPWLKELAETSGEDAAYLAQTLAKECPLRGSFKNEIDEFRSKLGQSEAAIAHVKGREALDEFSKKELSKYGDHYSPLKEHAPKKFERMTELLADKNPKAKDLHEIFKQLAKPTHR